jgi:hypothetical protein
MIGIGVGLRDIISTRSGIIITDPITIRAKIPVIPVHLQAQVLAQQVRITAAEDVCWMKDNQRGCRLMEIS